MISANKQLNTIVVLALSTGMRKGEILNLNRRDVFLNEGFLVLEKTKNKERRRVPIIGYAHEVLTQHLKIARLDSDYVFPSKDGKQPIDIADASGMGRTYMGRVERGEQNISIQNLIQIAFALNVEVEKLIPKLSDLKNPYIN